jgi:hypothetical protein
MGAVYLVLRLQRVTPVHENRGAMPEHDREACRSGKSGEPGQALLRRRQIFVLIAIGMGDHEAAEPAVSQLRAQRREPWPACRTIGAIFE